MGDVINIDALIHRIEKAESELEVIKFELLKLKAEALPPEDIDEATKKAFEEDIKDFVEGKVETISGKKAVKLLLASLKND